MENNRRKTVQRLKKLIVTVTIVLLVAPSIFCIVLAVKVGKLERQIQQLKENSSKSLEIIWDDNNQPRAESRKSYEKKESGDIDKEEQVTEENLRKVYLTFDDGPSVYTKEILEILKSYDVQATFFVTGMNVPMYDKYLQQIVNEGHSLGIHTYSHVYKDIYASLEAFQNDYNKMKDYIYQCTGTETKLYRFPGGSANTIVTDRTRQEILKWLEEEEVVYFDWNVSAKDAENQTLSADEIAENCIEGVKKCNTAIVLLHDGAGKKSTVEALPLIIEGINELDDTILLPMDTETVKLQQVKITKE